jgi:hypothetical protein
MTLKTAGQFTVIALGMMALAGCVTAPAPAPAPAAPPVIVQTPAAPPAGSVVVTPRAY